jgi:3-hydroxybutyryl-CoA dehydratase
MTPASYANLKIGQTAELSKKVTDEMVRAFAEISEDRNPAHLDDEYAKASFFKQRIAHGMLGAGLISAVMAMKLPGPGAIYLSQNLKFKAPVYIGDTMTAKAEVVELNDSKKIVTLNTTVVKQDGTVVIEGQAMIKLFS